METKPLRVFVNLYRVPLIQIAVRTVLDSAGPDGTPALMSIADVEEVNTVAKADIIIRSPRDILHTKFKGVIITFGVDFNSETSAKQLLCLIKSKAEKPKKTNILVMRRA